MLIVIEGVDGAGKTTLAEALGGRYVHFGPPAGDPFEEYAAALKEVTFGELTVIDRFHWGEMVYGPLYRGRSNLDPNQFWALEHMIRQLGGIKVLMAPPKHVVDMRLGMRGETFLKPEHVGRVMSAFRAVYDVAYPVKHILGEIVEMDHVVSTLQNGARQLAFAAQAFEDARWN